MKILVFSDVHGNILAFEKMLKKHNDSDQYICLGDIVNYGPHSNECVDLLDSLPDNTVKIIGNHEEAFIEGHYNAKHPVSKAFYEFCYPHFKRTKEISTYVESYDQYGFHFTHTINNEYIYADSVVTFDENLMIGHSHRQYFIEDKSHKLYNPGSVGQNRINIAQAQYLILYPNSGKVVFETIDYNFYTLYKEMKAKKYPKICLDYYIQKSTLNL